MYNPPTPPLWVEILGACHDSMCPDCNEELVVYELDGVEVDHCLTCGGTWLDSGELELLAELGGVAPGRISGALHRARTEGRSERRCPRCRGRLQVIHVGEEKPVELDRCPRGHGLWLDRGETEALVAAFGGGGEGEGEEGAVARFFANLYQDELS